MAVQAAVAAGKGARNAAAAAVLGARVAGLLLYAWVERLPVLVE